MRNCNIKADLDDLLRDVAKDIVRGARSNTSLVATNVLGWGDGQVIARIDHHVRQLSDQQYRVERVGAGVRQTQMPHIPGMSAYCARIDNRTNEPRYFGLGPYADPLEWCR